MFCFFSKARADWNYITDRAVLKNTAKKYIFLTVILEYVLFCLSFNKLVMTNKRITSKTLNLSHEGSLFKDYG